MTPLTPYGEKVAEVLRSHFPPGAPDIFRRVVRVTLEKGPDGYPIFCADLVMFDGLPGRVRVGKFDMAGHLSWWQAWEHMSGGACSFEDGEWVRIDLDGRPVLPLFRVNASRTRSPLEA